MNKIKVIELFGGIGGPRKGIKKSGVDFEIVDYVENNKHAVNSYNEIFSENHSPQDIKKWNKQISADLIIHGSPCQDFSKEGTNKGGKKGSGTKSSLVWETIRIVNIVLPSVVIWENVASAKSFPVYDEYLEEMESMGYINYKFELNAKAHGIPQHRNRIYVVSSKFEIDFKIERNYNPDVHSILKDINKDDMQKYNDRSRLTMPLHKQNKMLIRTGTKAGFMYGEIGELVDLNFPNSKTRRARIIKDRSCPTITRASNTIGIILDDLEIYYLKTVQLWLLSGFTEEDYNAARTVCSERQLQMQIGNVAVPDPIAELIRNIYGSDHE